MLLQISYQKSLVMDSAAIFIMVIALFFFLDNFFK